MVGPGGRVTEMMLSTNGRDQVMSLLQFLPGVLEPAVRRLGTADQADSLRALAELSAQYRAVTRLHGLWKSFQGKHAELSRREPHDELRAITLLGHIKWVADVCFFWTEAQCVLTAAGAINRTMSPERKAQLPARCVWFFFWALLFGQLRCFLQLTECTSRESRRRREHLQKSCFGQFLWWVLAWAMLPRDRSVRIFGDPLQPPSRLQRIATAVTAPGLQLGPWAMHCIGLLATLPPLGAAWQAGDPLRRYRAAARPRSHSPTPAAAEPPASAPSPTTRRRTPSPQPAAPASVSAPPAAQLRRGRTPSPPRPEAGAPDAAQPAAEEEDWRAREAHTE
eukprot:TRINITY_DN13093_c0_g1_i1.p1 TRINITY_DN13093_c0_g1~~TRINITY_DN13093_c0_g1_i1.p1  ORF type:complete len:367 (+),score=115.17 TRINITY_DN13093_c0_g1_i1:91-1101(+)